MPHYNVIRLHSKDGVENSHNPSRSCIVNVSHTFVSRYRRAVVCNVFFTEWVVFVAKYVNVNRLTSLSLPGCAVRVRPASRG